MSAALPWLQAEFCEGVCLPVYRALASLHTGFRQMEEAVRENRDRWRLMARDRQDQRNI